MKDKEQTISNLRKLKSFHNGSYGTDIDRAIKALEQEYVLDKIRAEIETLPKTYPFVNHFDTYVKEDDVKRIIDKHRGESEEQI